ncbi:MAG TPA: alginate lyase family protein [Woeseiaceae bacterium]|nr:alginate lyase family protein [Woeseiaceae bacterium]
MSVPEIGHRLGRSLRVRGERAGWFRARRPPAALLEREPPAWIAGVAGLDSAVYTSAAERLIAGEQPVFALESAGAEPWQWNRDPLTGITAPLQFGKLIDYRDERVVGNIKYLWEPNRHLEFVTLAQAYALTRDGRYLAGLRERLESWLEQCPYPCGPNWASALEAGIRLVNWSIAWQLVGGRRSALFEEAGAGLRERWLDSIYRHAHFIRHYYSRHSSANNHLIGEAAGVFIAACTWPYWKELERWGAEARRLLVDAAGAQTHPDGVNREQAVAYQQFVLDFFILSALAGRSSGLEFPQAYWQTIERMLEYLHAIMDVAGNVPMIGDADDGFVVRLSQERDFCPFRSLLATGAILFDRTEFAAGRAVLDDKTRCLVGGERWNAVARAAGGASPRRAFPDGGYFILGQRLGSDDEIRLVADAGPLGYLSIAAHGHADALSFVLSVAGREMLVDPGTYSYHTEPRWREYFRGTGAHNTVRVDGLDQSMQGGNFMWLRHAAARCLEFDFGTTCSRFTGEHDGYTRLEDPVVHRRSIVQDKGTIEIVDTLRCNGYHSVERCWHFSEKCRVSLEGTTVVAQQGPVRITLRALEPVREIKRLYGSDDPPGGWVSRRFDVKTPAESLYFVNAVRGTAELKTTIECEIDRYMDTAKHGTME